MNTNLFSTRIEIFVENKLLFIRWKLFIYNEVKIYFLQWFPHSEAATIKTADEFTLDSNHFFGSTQKRRCTDANI